MSTFHNMFPKLDYVLSMVEMFKLEGSGIRHTRNISDGAYEIAVGLIWSEFRSTSNTKSDKIRAVRALMLWDLASSFYNHQCSQHTENYYHKIQSALDLVAQEDVLIPIQLWWGLILIIFGSISTNYATPSRSKV